MSASCHQWPVLFYNVPGIQLVMIYTHIAIFADTVITEVFVNHQYIIIVSTLLGLERVLGALTAMPSIILCENLPRSIVGVLSVAWA